MQLELSGHAERRSCQRNLRPDEIMFVVENGFRVRKTGVVFCQLRAKDVPKQYVRDGRYRQLIGTTVLLCGRCARYVLTVYRNPEAFRQDRSKAKYHKCADARYCPCCAEKNQPAA